MPGLKDKKLSAISTSCRAGQHGIKLMMKKNGVVLRHFQTLESSNKQEHACAREGWSTRDMCDFDILVFSCHANACCHQCISMAHHMNETSGSSRHNIFVLFCLGTTQQLVHTFVLDPTPMYVSSSYNTCVAFLEKRYKRCSGQELHRVAKSY